MRLNPCPLTITSGIHPEPWQSRIRTCSACHQSSREKTRKVQKRRGKPEEFGLVLGSIVAVKSQLLGLRLQLTTLHIVDNVQLPRAHSRWCQSRQPSRMCVFVCVAGVIQFEGGPAGNAEEAGCVVPASSSSYPRAREWRTHAPRPCYL